MPGVNGFPARPKLSAVETSLPNATVLLPVLDEVGTIDACLQSLGDQDYRGKVSIVVAEGGSTDGTRSRLEVWDKRGIGLEVIDNPGRLQSLGLNLAAQTASGEILVRADAHTWYAPDYITRSVSALFASDAVAVGGSMIVREPEKPAAGWQGRLRRAVGAAMASSLAIGPGKFHRHGYAGETDTVYLGTFRRADFLELGGYRAFPSAVAEDADLYYRWRRQGRKVLLDPSIVSSYTPRGTLRGLFRQYYKYGRGKADMLWANGRLPSLRPLAPLLLVLGLLGGGTAALLGWWWPLAILAVAWLLELIIAALTTRPVTPLAVVAGAVMQVAYGVGLVGDLLKGPWAARRAAANAGL